MTQVHSAGNNGNNAVGAGSNSDDSWMDEFEVETLEDAKRKNLAGEKILDADDLCILWGDEGEHPLLKKVDWMDEVARGETLSGYWERVADYLYNKADELAMDEDFTASE